MIENTQTILVVLGQESNAKTCASLVLRMESESAQWLSTAGGPRQTEALLLEGFISGVERVSTRRQEEVLMKQLDAKEERTRLVARVANKYGRKR